MWRKVAAAGFVGMALLSACAEGGSSGGSPAAAPPAFLMPCGSGDTCAPGLGCVEMEYSSRFCTQPCPDGACPAGSACGKTADGSPVCTFPCSAPREVSTIKQTFACENGARVACQQAAPASCADCGCDPTLRCELDVGCVERLAEGQPCKAHGDCKSENCGFLTGVCNVPIGAKCAGALCDKCVQGQGREYCTRDCGSEPCGAGFLCGGGTCYPGCSGCPAGSCRSFSQSTLTYCECTGPCTITLGKGTAGRGCTDNSTCASGYCGSNRCALACAADAECPSGQLCVARSPGAPTVCAACTDCKYCKTGESVDGAEASWCDDRKADGLTCAKPAECAANACTGGRCGTGIENGSACSTSNQCTSKNCIGGACKGSGLVGDPCIKSSDCSVGGCCSSGASAGKCASGC